MERIIGIVRDISFLQPGGSVRARRRAGRSAGSRFTLNGYSTDNWRSISNGLASGLSYFWKPVYSTQSLQAMSSSTHGAPTTAGRYGYSMAGITPHTLYSNISNFIKNGMSSTGSRPITLDTDSLRNKDWNDTYLYSTLPSLNGTGIKKLGIGPYAQPQKDDNIRLASVGTWTPSVGTWQLQNDNKTFTGMNEYYDPLTITPPLGMTR